jgi:hypothetical protein
MKVVSACASWTPPATGRRSLRAATPVAGVITVSGGAVGAIAVAAVAVGVTAVAAVAGVAVAASAVTVATVATVSVSDATPVRVRRPSVRRRSGG